MAGTINFKKLDDKAVLPSRGSVHAAALDLSSIDSITIAPGDYSPVRTGLAVEIPVGHYGRIAGRSGLAAKKGIDVLGGVVDCDYRGELVCIMANLGKEHFVISAGDRIAQFIIEAIITPEPVFVEELTDSSRMDKGFGSTGK